MRLRGLHRFGFALWLGLLALTASGIAQNQLSTNVLIAKLAESGSHAASGHYMPDGTFMAGPMSDMADCQPGDAAKNSDGHTHKGHADCTLCGAVAAMAALTLSVAESVLVPDIFAAPDSWPSAPSIFFAAPRAPYASRAPPRLMG